MSGRARTSFSGSKIETRLQRLKARRTGSEHEAELHPVKDEYKLNNAAIKDKDQITDDDTDLLGPTIDGAPRNDLRKLHVVDGDPDLDPDTDPMLRGR